MVSYAHVLTFKIGRCPLFSSPFIQKVSQRPSVHSNSMLCIYCGTREADGREHYLPQCLGRFNGDEPLLDRLCQACNQTIGGEVEREFCRNSPEAVLRSFYPIKGQRRGGRAKRPTQIYEPERIGGKHMSLYAPSPGSNERILWRLGSKPGTLTQVSQVLIYDDEDELVQHIPIPTSITSGHDLRELLLGEGVTFPIPNMLVIAAPSDEERVLKLFDEIDASLNLQRCKGGRIQQQHIQGEVTSAYFRALAKVGFHYVLKYVPTIKGNESEFQPLREFIRHGIGDPGKFLAWSDTLASPTGSPGHLLRAVAISGSPIVVDMQFFAGHKIPLPQWRLIVGNNPTRVIAKQVSAHFFSYAEGDDGQPKGGEVVRLS